MKRVTKKDVESRLRAQVRRELETAPVSGSGGLSELAHTVGSTGVDEFAIGAPIRSLPEGDLPAEQLDALPLQLRFRAANVHALLRAEASGAALDASDRPLGGTHEYSAKSYQSLKKTITAATKELAKPIPPPRKIDNPLGQKLMARLNTPEGRARQKETRAKQIAELQTLREALDAAFSGPFEKLRKKSKTPLVSTQPKLANLETQLRGLHDKVAVSTLPESTRGALVNTLYAAIDAVAMHANMPNFPEDAGGEWFATLDPETQFDTWRGTYTDPRLQKSGLAKDSNLVEATAVELLGDGRTKEMIDSVRSELDQMLESVDSQGAPGEPAWRGEVLLRDGKPLAYELGVRIENDEYSATMRVKTDLAGHEFDEDHSSDHH